MRLYTIVVCVALAMAFAFTALFYAAVALGGSGIDVAYFGFLWLGLVLATQTASVVGYIISAFIGVLFSLPASLLIATLPIGALPRLSRITIAFVIVALIAQYALRWLAGASRPKQQPSSSLPR